VGLRLNEATTQVGRMEVRTHNLELALASTNSERDTQRAAAEQRVHEAQQQIAALRSPRPLLAHRQNAARH
jgi:hypothetical protein